jgi:hypothetical protein
MQNEELIGKRLFSLSPQQERVLDLHGALECPHCKTRRAFAGPTVCTLSIDLYAATDEPGCTRIEALMQCPRERCGGLVRTVWEGTPAEMLRRFKSMVRGCRLESSCHARLPVLDPAFLNRQRTPTFRSSSRIQPSRSHPSLPVIGSDEARAAIRTIRRARTWRGVLRVFGVRQPP